MTPWNPRSTHGPRTTGTWLVITALTLLPWSAAVNLWFAKQKLYLPLVEASGEWLQPALQVCLPSICLYLLFFRLGGLRPRDLGLRRELLVPGLVATLASWVALNLIVAIGCEGDVQMSAILQENPARPLGALLAQLFGNAMWEEILYRGFFLTQLVRHFGARGWHDKRSLLFAVFLSAVAFAVPHIPNRLVYDLDADVASLLSDQLRLLLVGCYLAWVYLRTKNLWWMIGFHSLANSPALLVDWDGPYSSKLLVSICGTVLTLLWPYLPALSAKDREAGTEDA